MTDTIKTEDLQAILDKYVDQPANSLEATSFFEAVKGLLPDETMNGKDWNYDDHFLAEARLSPGWESEYAIMLGKDTYTGRIRCIIKGDNSTFALPPQELTPTGRKAKIAFETGLMVDEDGDLWEEIDGRWVIGPTPEIRKDRAGKGHSGNPKDFNARPYIEEF